jgi:putative transposase
MTVDPNSIGLAQVMTEHLERAEPDLLRDLLRVFVQAVEECRRRRHRELAPVR